MQFCPEIAVFSSALQLFKRKVEVTEPLETASKETCLAHSEILTTAIAEIVDGLQCPSDASSRSLWQQKMHALLLYSLIKKNYKTSAQCDQGQVPVLDSINILTSSLPAFSSHVYFMLLEPCNWMDLFQQSLYNLDYTTSYKLLKDALHHFQTDSISYTHNMFIGMLTEKLLSKSFCVPEFPEPTKCITSQLLGPLSQPQKFITVMFPGDNEEAESRGSNSYTAEKKSDNDNAVSQEEVFDTFDGKADLQFWFRYVRDDADFLPLVIDNLKKAVNEFEQIGDKFLNCDSLFTALLGQLVFLYSVTDVLFVNSELAKWLINNLAPLPDREESWKHAREASADICCLNYPMIEYMHEHIGEKHIRGLLERLLCNAGLVDKQMELTGSDPVSLDQDDNDDDIVKSSQKMDDSGFKMENVAGLVPDTSCMIVDQLGSEGWYGVELVPCLVVCWPVLSRFLKDKLSVPVGDLRSILGSASVDNDDTTEALVTSGDHWSQDVSLAALLWRISNRLSHYEACIDYLLSDECPVFFWQCDRLYVVLTDQLCLLQHQNRVLALAEIYQQKIQEPKLRHLMIAAFTGLSPLDKDHVIKRLYELGETSMIQVEDQEQQMTKVFNKITADLDSQVREELYLMFISHPRAVLCRAISAAVDNEEQAANMPQVCRLVPSLCQSLDKDLQDGTLLTVCLQRFLASETLSTKQQKHFTAFVRALMMPYSASHLPTNRWIMDPRLFLQTVVLPAITFEPNCPISIKFTLNLLLACLEAGCNKSCDWSNFEPMALVLLLLELLHDCVVVWQKENLTLPVDIADEDDLESESVAMETRFDRLVVKEQTLQALDGVWRLMEGQYFVTPDDVSVSWLLTMTDHLHWSIRLYMCPLLSLWGHTQVVSDIIQGSFNHVTATMETSLVPFLHFVSLGPTFRNHVMYTNTTQPLVDYNVLVTALVQLLPNLVYHDWTMVLDYVEHLLVTDHLDMIYRLQSTQNVPCLGFLDARVSLCVVQLLTDVVRTMLNTLTLGTHLPLLQNVLQTYVTIVQEKCTGEHKTTTMTSFVLGEVFQHVINVATDVPRESLDIILVLLLHTVKKFKNIAMETDSENYEMEQGLNNAKMNRVNCCMMEDTRNKMLIGVERLPAVLEETQMIRKLLC